MDEPQRGFGHLLGARVEGVAGRDDGTGEAGGEFHQQLEHAFAAHGLAIEVLALAVEPELRDDAVEAGQGVDHGGAQVVVVGPAPGRAGGAFVRGPERQQHGARLDLVERGDDPPVRRDRVVGAAVQEHDDRQRRAGRRRQVETDGLAVIGPGEKAGLPGIHGQRIGAGVGIRAVRVVRIVR